MVLTGSWRASKWCPPQDARVKTRAPIEVAAWTNEEGSRFVPTMMGSGVFSGVYALDYALGQKDTDGVSVKTALEAIGYAGEAKPHAVGAYFEAHIEQGPVLEASGTTIGVVQGALGQRWLDVVITGQDSHAGPTPMETRKDALLAASRLVLEVNRIATTFPDSARGTVGSMQVKPNSRNVVPGEVRMTVDFRKQRPRREVHCSRGENAAVPRRRSAEVVLVRAARARKVAARSAPAGYSTATLSWCGTRCGTRGRGHGDGAFCEGGISHNEIENAKPEDIAAGCNVLLHAVLARACA